MFRTAVIEFIHDISGAPGVHLRKSTWTMSDEASQGDREPKRSNRTPEVEAVIGARIRALRVAAGMSQTTLGEAIGVSFQQCQKYEKGKDRIAASTLQVLAAALGVHPGSFFDGEMPSPSGDVPDVRSALEGAAGLQRISDPKVRKQLGALIDVLADKSESWRSSVRRPTRWS